MKKNKKKGFTLVELLAVIVILAIVLVIAVPKVMNVIKDSKKATLESTAKMIASSAEKVKAQNDLLGKTEKLECESVAKINDIDYGACDIVFDGNTAKVTIKGKGKFANLYVCNGTKISAETTDEKCIEPLTAETLAALCTDDATCTANSLVKDMDGNVRYYGSNPNNYIEFNDEVWRIIGVFNVKTNASDTDEQIQQRIKIVRNDELDEKMVFGNYSWLNSKLGLYLNGTTAGNYYYGLTSISKIQISQTVWNTGSVNIGASPAEAYNNEKSNQTQESIVGLISASDYGYAGGTTCTSLSQPSCGQYNWLSTSSYYWTITPRSGDSTSVLRITSTGASIMSLTSSGYVRPSVFLNANAKLSGTGQNTADGIYKIS